MSRVLVTPALDGAGAQGHHGAMSDSSAPPQAIASPAATVLLVRDQPAFEVLMVKRHHQIDFASGALVFPGGKIDPGDADPAWAEHCSGWDAHGEEERRLRIAALREVFEESGVLLARDREGIPWRAVEAAAALREKISGGVLSFIELVRTLDVRLDLEALVLFARWLTPRMSPKRFDTWFFIATAPEGQFAVCDGHETVDAEWIEPSAGLELARRGERKIIFPTRMNLGLLAESRAVDEAIEAARARRSTLVEPRIEVRDGERYLTLAPDAGYGVVAERLTGAIA
jgi:8-oxo-dGTP pyrophosphatase MutT (NUDIX family)